MSYNNVENGTSILLYLNDDKYNIHGIVEVDPTRGREYGENGYDYKSTLYNYSAFGQSLIDSHQLFGKKSYAFDNSKINAFKMIDWLDFAIYCKKIDLPLEESSNDFYLKMAESVGDTINNSELIDLYNNCLLCINRNELDTANEFLVKIKNVIYKNGISFEGFKKAYIKVKMIEHMINPDKYPYSKVLLDRGYQTWLGNNWQEYVMQTLNSKYFISSEDISIVENYEILENIYVSNDELKFNPLLIRK